jgi:nucleoside-diphosphate-sugar epimerase
MKVLVTGSSGRIGSAVVRRLQAQHQVVGLDRVPGPCTQFVADVGDAPALEGAMHGVQAVVHTAALHAPHVGQVPDAEFERVNVMATRTLIALAVALGVPRLVYTSTTALYGVSVEGSQAAAWIDELSLPRPRTVYHRTKLAAEALLEDAALRGALSVSVLRMSRCFPEAAPRMAAYRLHRGIDARDVADAHALALLGLEPGLQRFVISAATPFDPDDAPALMRDAPRVIARRAPAVAEAFARRGWPLPARIDRVYCSERAMRSLGWRPKFGIEEVLKQWDAGSPDVLAP